MNTAVGIFFALAAAWIFFLNGSILIALNRRADGMTADEWRAYRQQISPQISNHVGLVCMSPVLAGISTYFFKSDSFSFSSLIGSIFAIFGAGAILQSFFGRATKELTHSLALRDGVQPISTSLARIGSFVFGASALAVAYWLMY